VKNKNLKLQKIREVLEIFPKGAHSAAQKNAYVRNSNASRVEESLKYESTKSCSVICRPTTVTSHVTTAPVR
jgi:hypothetical protein